MSASALTPIQCRVMAAAHTPALHQGAQAVAAALAQCENTCAVYEKNACSNETETQTETETKTDSNPAQAVLLVSDNATLSETLRWASRLRGQSPHQALLVVCLHADAAALTALIGAGIYDFVMWPASTAELHARLRRALGLIPTTPTTDVRGMLTPRMRHFVGASPALERQIAKLPMFAGCNAGVLIVGETGTGKEVCAQSIHYLSARASKPWVAVNCGAIPNDLVESELFGHVKGAYTTAHASREGLVREAEGGTLFLDDVDCLPLPAQAKLLRFLQEREYRPVGSNTVRTADVRVISASNQRLMQLVTRGEFRQDLYFRLKILTLDLPALRQRREDIPALTLHFIAQFAQQFKRAVSGVTPRALQCLLEHEWPGNVRELKHVIERAVLLCTGPTLTETDLGFGGANETGSDAETFASAKARIIEHFERNYLQTLLANHGGNITHAAQAASKNRRAFFELMRKHQIQPAQFRVNP